MTWAKGRARRAAGIVLAVTLVLLPQFALASDGVELWLELGLRQKIVSDLRCEVSGQLRLDQDVSRVQSILPQAELGYRFLSWLRASGGYRLAYERDKGGDFEFGHRLFADAKTKTRMSVLHLSFRSRLQDEWERSGSGEWRSKPTLRDLAGVTLAKWKKVEPTVSVEHFLALDDLDELPTRKWRLTAGPEVRAGKVQIEPFYRLEFGDDEDGLWKTHIVGLALTAQPWKE